MDKPGECRNCKYYETTDSSRGLCHLNPPITNVNNPGTSAYPTVSETNWCSFYKA